jgi:hypothetical protein
MKFKIMTLFSPIKLTYFTQHNYFITLQKAPQTIHKSNTRNVANLRTRNLTLRPKSHQVLLLTGKFFKKTLSKTEDLLSSTLLHQTIYDAAWMFYQIV